MLLLGMSLCEEVGAATYYVAPTGNDTNPGTFLAPFKSVSKGVSVAEAGDMVYVQNGTYVEEVRLSRSGKPGAPIVLAAYPGHAPVIQHPWDSAVVNIAAGGGPISVGWLTLEGFEIYSTYSGNKLRANGISVHNAHDTIIRRNTIHDVRHGIIGTGKDVTISRNVIYHNGRFDVCLEVTKECNQDHGIYGTGSNWTITNNLIYDNLAYGIQIAGYEFNPRAYTDSSYAGASGWFVAHNTIAYNNYRAGIVVWRRAATNGIFKNNIFYENAQRLSSESPQGIDFYYSGPGHVVQNNAFYATTPGGTVWIKDTNTSYLSSDNLTIAQPLFVNAGPSLPFSPNFQLQSESPVINMGVNFPEVKEDLPGITPPGQRMPDTHAHEANSPPDVQDPVTP